MTWIQSKNTQKKQKNTTKLALIYGLQSKDKSKIITNIVKIGQIGQMVKIGQIGQK